MKYFLVTAHFFGESFHTGCCVAELSHCYILLVCAEGTEGFIQTGNQIAYSSYNNGTEYKDVTTGFYVLPRIRGNGVMLKVRPFKNSQSNTGAGSIETQSANTTISGRLGEWLPLGGVTEQFKHSQSGIGSSSSAEGSNKYSIWIRADLIQ
jgi:hypothetical protein